jgi:hypothetical protein
MISIKPDFWNILRRNILFVFGPKALFSPALELAGQVGLDSVCSRSLCLCLSQIDVWDIGFLFLCQHL